MKLDKKALERLTSLNDSQLKSVIGSIAKESGIDLSSFGISSGDIESVRKVLSVATDDDLKLAQEQLRIFKNEKRERE